MIKKQKILIYGASEHPKVVCDIVEKENIYEIMRPPTILHNQKTKILYNTSSLKIIKWLI